MQKACRKCDKPFEEVGFFGASLQSLGKFFKKFILLLKQFGLFFDLTILLIQSLLLVLDNFCQDRDKVHR